MEKVLYSNNKLYLCKKKKRMKLQFQYYKITNIKGLDKFIVLPHEKWLPFAVNTVFEKSISQKDLETYILEVNPNIPKTINSIKKISQKEYQEHNGGYEQCIYTLHNEYYKGKLPEYYEMWEIINENCCSGILTDLIGYIDDLERIYIENNIFDIRGLEMLHYHMTSVDPAIIIESATRLLYGISTAE